MYPLADDLQRKFIKLLRQVFTRVQAAPLADQTRALGEIQALLDQLPPPATTTAVNAPAIPAANVTSTVTAPAATQGI
jgi:hypothetical protein